MSTNGDAAPRGPGRPSTLTNEVTEAICGFLLQGHYFATACRLADVSPETAREWLERGQNRHHRSPTLETRAFADAVERASAQAEHNALRQVLAGGRGWQGPAWFLERRFPGRWSDRKSEDVEKVGRQVVEAIRRVVDDPELGLEARAARVRPAPPARRARPPLHDQGADDVP
jgi:hypothetical protein